MVVDSLACVFAALVGTTTSGAYIESATGIREGARTGLAAVVTGLLFAVALFFLPLTKHNSFYLYSVLNTRSYEPIISLPRAR